MFLFIRPTLQVSRIVMSMFIRLLVKTLRKHQLQEFVPLILLDRFVLMLFYAYVLHTGSITDYTLYCSVIFAFLSLWIFIYKIVPSPLASACLFHIFLLVIDYLPTYLLVRSAIKNVFEQNVVYEELPTIIIVSVYLAKRIYYHKKPALPSRPSYFVSSVKSTSQDQETAKFRAFLVKLVFELPMCIAYNLRIRQCLRKNDIGGLIMVAGDLLIFASTLIVRENVNKYVILDEFLGELRAWLLSNTDACMIGYFTFVTNNIMNVSGLIGGINACMIGYFTFVTNNIMNVSGLIGDINAYITGQTIGLMQLLRDVVSFCISWQQTFMILMRAMHAQAILTAIGYCPLLSCYLPHILARIVGMRYFNLPEILEPELLVLIVLGALCLVEITHR